jgi:hypothetical protein
MRIEHPSIRLTGQSVADAVVDVNYKPVTLLKKGPCGDNGQQAPEDDPSASEVGKSATT